jgi:hypothetical protein
VAKAAPSVVAKAAPNDVVVFNVRVVALNDVLICFEHSVGPL